MEMNTCRMSHVLGKLCDATIFAQIVARAVARDKQCDKHPGFLMRSRYARRVCIFGRPVCPGAVGLAYLPTNLSEGQMSLVIPLF
jgi:hypothetical protein